MMHDRPVHAYEETEWNEGMLTVNALQVAIQG